MPPISADQIALGLQRPMTSLKPATAPKEETPSLGDSFAKILDDVNQQQVETEAKKKEFLTSDQKDLTGTIVSMEKAEISLRMLLQVRGKLTTAYEEIMRMQV